MDNQNNIIIPELLIYNSLLASVKMVNSNWSDNIDKTKTILYDMFGSSYCGGVVKLDSFDYLKQAKALFLKDCGDSRQMDIHIGYNLKRMALPTIHILLPNESGGIAGIGNNEGYQDGVSEGGTYIPRFTASNTTTYNLMITSDNYMEVVLVYHFLKYAFLSLSEHFSIAGMQNPSYSGSDLTVTQDLAPPNIFHRNFMISFTYEYSALSFFGRETAGGENGVNFTPNKIIDC